MLYIQQMDLFFNLEQFYCCVKLAEEVSKNGIFILYYTPGYYIPENLKGYKRKGHDYLDSPVLIEMKSKTWEYFLETGSGYPWDSNQHSFGFSGIDSLICYNGFNVFNEMARPIWTNVSYVFLQMFMDFTAKEWNDAYFKVLAGFAEWSRILSWNLRKDNSIYIIENYEPYQHMSYLFLHKIFEQKRKLDFINGLQTIIIFQFDEDSRRFQTRIETFNRKEKPYPEQLSKQIKPFEETKNSNNDFLVSHNRNGLVFIQGYGEDNKENIPLLYYGSQQWKNQDHPYFENDIIWVKGLPKELIILAEDLVTNLISDLFSHRYMLKRDVISMDLSSLVNNINSNELFYPLSYYPKRLKLGYFDINNEALKTQPYKVVFSFYAIREKNVLYFWKLRLWHLKSQANYFSKLKDEINRNIEDSEKEIANLMDIDNGYKTFKKLEDAAAVYPIKGIEQKILEIDAHITRQKERLFKLKDIKQNEETKNLLDLRFENRKEYELVKRNEPKDPDQIIYEFREPEAGLGIPHYILIFKVNSDNDNLLDYELQRDEANKLYHHDLLSFDERECFNSDLVGIVANRDINIAANNNPRPIVPIELPGQIPHNEYSNMFWDRILNLRFQARNIREHAERFFSPAAIYQGVKEGLYVGGQSYALYYFNNKFGTYFKNLTHEGVKEEVKNITVSNIQETTSVSTQSLKQNGIPGEVVDKLVETVKSQPIVSDIFTPTASIIFQGNVSYPVHGSEWHLQRKISDGDGSFFIYEASSIHNTSMTDPLYSGRWYEKIEESIDFTSSFRIENSTMIFPSFNTFLEQKEPQVFSFYNTLSIVNRERKHDFFLYIQNPRRTSINTFTHAASQFKRWIMKARVSSDILHRIKFDWDFHDKFFEFYKVFIEGNLFKF